MLVPWTSINLSDFYVTHKGKYDIRSIFRVDGGIYRRFNPQAMIAYEIGIGVHSAHECAAVYGPVLKYFDGADLSWVIGLVLRSRSILARVSRHGYRRRQVNADITRHAVRQS